MNEELQLACAIFEHPERWTNPTVKYSVAGAERSNIIRVRCVNKLDEMASDAVIGRIRHVAVVGINPQAIGLALLLRERGRQVVLMPSGHETTVVKAKLRNAAVEAFFRQRGITCRTCPPLAFRGAQIHCQSGYCPYICEGRFIEESEAVGRILTDEGTVYADMVFLTFLD